MPSHSFGIAWIAFALALVIHVADEARHDFLTTYNSTVRAIRARLPFLPIPTFTFKRWLAQLLAGILLLLCLSPFAFSGSHWLRVAALPLAALVGILNAALHLCSSAYFCRWMPSVYNVVGIFEAFDRFISHDIVDPLFNCQITRIDYFGAAALAGLSKGSYELKA